MTAPSIEGIPEPRDAEGPTARRELADRDLEGVRDRFGEEERRRPEGNLQRPGAEDAGSLKTSENHENVSVATKGRASKKVSSLARGDRSTEVVPHQNQVYQDQTRDERRNRRADAPDDREDHDDDRQPPGPWSKVQETRADRDPDDPEDEDDRPQDAPGQAEAERETDADEQGRKGDHDDAEEQEEDSPEDREDREDRHPDRTRSGRCGRRDGVSGQFERRAWETAMP